MRTLGRLRAERYRFWSTPSVITSAEAMPILLNFCARSLVLGASMSKLSTTFSRSSRASCDRIEHIRENLAASAPQRARDVPGAGAAGALLAPGLLVRVAHVAAPFLRARAAAGVRLVGRDHLVHQRFVILAPEQG